MIEVMGSQQQSLLRLGDWAVMEQRGVVHLADLVDGLPRGRGLCGAVGTAFVVREPLRRRICERCTAIARAEAAN